jgi:hypothetical protein
MSNDQHSFSIEMKSIKHVDKISISSKTNNEVLFEGELGRRVQIKLIEGVLLEISGCNGVFRIDLTENELSQVVVT